MNELAGTHLSPEPPPSQRGTSSIDSATIELLAAWRAQDATDDPGALRIAEAELAEFKNSMNENRVRVGAYPVYP